MENSAYINEHIKGRVLSASVASLGLGVALTGGALLSVKNLRQRHPMSNY
jgi:hypothetical protein